MNFPEGSFAYDNSRSGLFASRFALIISSFQRHVDESSHSRVRDTMMSRLSFFSTLLFIVMEMKLGHIQLEIPIELFRAFTFERFSIHDGYWDGKILGNIDQRYAFFDLIVKYESYTQKHRATESSLEFTLNSFI